MLGKIVFEVIIIPLATAFTLLGVYAWKRKKPMWFWAGSEVKEDEITDVKAYNRANGIMWVCYSVVFWAGAIVGFFHLGAAGITIAVGAVAGIAGLIVAYRAICKKYKVRKGNGEIKHEKQE